MGRSKMDYSGVGPSVRSKEMIAILNEYVANDDGSNGRELCWVVHEEGRVCRRLEEHDG